MDLKNKIQSIWEYPTYLPYIQPKLTDEIIKNAENKIGYKLPDEYIDVLKIQNGGYIRYTLVHNEKFANEMIYGIGPFFPSILDNHFEFIEGLSFKLEGLIPFDSDGHWFLCLDYQENRSNPSITFIETDYDEKILVADSFKEYIELLKIETEGLFVVDSKLSNKETIKKISRELEIEFENQNDDVTYGYQLFRSKYKNSWIWIYPNKVPNGFIRKNDERYNELIHMVNSYKLKFPELSENALILKMNGVINKEIVLKLDKLNIKIVHLNEYVNK